jgi:hypothetical protein
VCTDFLSCYHNVLAAIRRGRVATRIVKGNENVYEKILMGEPVDFDVLHVMFAEGMKGKVGSKTARGLLSIWIEWEFVFRGNG